ncbi:MAG: hypothetical protein ABJF04_00680 [Reichenbachiella sp.]|uniref:hypothetical protein n=1 Tax=Reichenbachiella sp. TaxID=2184521 RepID=UPI00326729A2
MTILDFNLSEYSVGQALGLVFALIGGLVSITTTFQLLTKRKQIELKSLKELISAIIITVVGVYLFDMENSLRTNYVYVTGTTNGVFISGKQRKIRYNYQLDGINYSTTGWMVEGVIVEGGKYEVRVSPDNPEIARINFKTKVILA